MEPRTRVQSLSSGGEEPAEERPGGLRYRCGNGFFSLFQSSGKASSNHTQMAWEVEDIVSTVEWLRSRGVVFEEYDLLGLKTKNGIAEVTGNYPGSRAVGGRRPHGSGIARATFLRSASRYGKSRAHFSF
jgi:hypothetical protein